jgi:stearoyl-CoA desaturase (delta-9 desaturase)
MHAASPQTEALDFRRSEPTSQSASIKTPSAKDLRTENALVLAVVLIPFAGFVAAVAWGVVAPVDVVLFAAMYLVSTFGITIGFHRLFTHRSFECTRAVKIAFAIAGSLAVQGPVIRWVADHRRHHAFSDKPGDPHSPHLDRPSGVSETLRQVFHAHIGWFFASEKTRVKRFAPDLLADADIVRIDRHYFAWVVLTLAIPFALGGAATHSWRGALSGLLWGGLARLFLVHHVTWSINSICHVFGARPYETRDRSTNNLWLAIPSLGEAWHNAHHAFPTSAVHGLGKYEIDPSAWVIGGLERLGLAWNVKRPTPAQIAARTTRRA